MNKLSTSIRMQKAFVRRSRRKSPAKLTATIAKKLIQMGTQMNQKNQKMNQKNQMNQMMNQMSQSLSSPQNAHIMSTQTRKIGQMLRHSVSLLTRILLLSLMKMRTKQSLILQTNRKNTGSDLLTLKLKADGSGQTILIWDTLYGLQANQIMHLEENIVLLLDGLERGTNGMTHLARMRCHSSVTKLKSFIPNPNLL